jgi:integrase
MTRVVGSGDHCGELAGPPRSAPAHPDANEWHCGFLKDGSGADTPLATLDEARAAKQLAVWLRTRALTRERIAILWRGEDRALRERAFWRLLYETAARASEIVSLDIEHLDVPKKRARVRSEGAATEWVFWQTATALLLPRLLAGPSSGPVFLADRQPTRAAPSVDRFPLAGRARLSYRRAAELFSKASPGLSSINCAIPR